MRPDDVLEIITACGLSSKDAVVTPLVGGVSCDTHAIDTPSGSWVVKQALGTLRSAELWESDPRRIVAEAAALRWFHEISPMHVPQPFALVEEVNALVLPRAKQPSPDLRQMLLQKPTAIGEPLGKAIGTLLAQWHQWDPSGAIGTLLDDRSRLISLRVDPFYRDMAIKWPQYGAVISQAVEELLDSSYAVIHGDFTPKNILVVGETFWVIDPETAHIGHPVLDTASMLTHLVLKEIHHCDDEANRQSIRAFRLAFEKAISTSLVSLPESLSIHIGTILGVRIDGRSRVPYLNDSARIRVREVAHALLEGAAVEEVMNQ